MSSADPDPATGPATPAAPEAGGSRGPRWWVVAITFVGGVLVGVLQRLDDIVRRLQPIEPRLARDLQACRVTTRLEDQPPDQPANPASPPPTVPQPTATPTG